MYARFVITRVSDAAECVDVPPPSEAGERVACAELGYWRCRAAVGRRRSDVSTYLTRSEHEDSDGETSHL